MIDVSRMSSKGQVTVPIEIRKALNLKAGEKVAFIRESDGTVTIANSSLLALREVQRSFTDAAKEAGIKNESEVAAFLKAADED